MRQMRKKIYHDVVLDLVNGDSGKGKIAYSLSRSGDYDYCVRFSGGSNCGHTIYHNEQKFVFHQLPVGIIHRIKSIIGCGCVINVKKLFEEIQLLEDFGIEKVRENLIIAPSAHLITEQHLYEDNKDEKIGTTKQGIGPCYSSKALRTGIRAEHCDELKDFLDEDWLLKIRSSTCLFEGAQGFYLDIDHGDYPYVTSSPCTIAAAVQNGANIRRIDKVYGVCKAYDTYVGAKQFEDPTDDFLQVIRNVGNEFGATTGRPRQCNWLNLDKLIFAIKFNSVTHVVINKIDVLKNIWKFKIKETDSIREFSSSELFQEEVAERIYRCCPEVVSVVWSESKSEI